MSDIAKEANETLTFKETVALLKGAHEVMVVPDGDGTDVLADFVGFSEEGDENSSFNIGIEGWDDIALDPEESASIVKFRGIIGVRFPGSYCTIVPLYGKAAG